MLVYWNLANYVAFMSSRRAKIVALVCVAYFVPFVSFLV